MISLNNASPCASLPHSLVLDVLEPEPVCVAQSLELLLDNGPEELSRPVPALQHPSDVQVDVHDVPVVGLHQLVEHLRVLLGQLRVHLSQVVYHRQLREWGEGRIENRAARGKNSKRNID